jgi:hypothetical protein
MDKDSEKIIKERTEAYKRLFMTDDGKTVLADLRSFCGQDKTSVNSELNNPYQVFFAEGKRRVFLRIDSFLRKEEENG